MRSILCIFFPHRWIYVGYGLYQCTRCKATSVGTTRG